MHVQVEGGGWRVEPTCRVDAAGDTDRDDKGFLIQQQWDNIVDMRQDACGHSHVLTYLGDGSLARAFQAHQEDARAASSACTHARACDSNRL